MKTIKLQGVFRRISRLLKEAVFCFMILILCGGCGQPGKPEAQLDFIRFVNPMIGTNRMGHTFPGATVPFGMVQLSPDTDTVGYAVDGKYNPKVYEYCAGYQYGDPTIVGFSHTHFSGTGHSDLGDFLIMTTTRLSGNCIPAWNFIEFAIQYFIIALRSHSGKPRKTE